jgi:alkaline phosphatase
MRFGERFLWASVVVAAAVAWSVLAGAAWAKGAKNVILLIGDGAGFNSFRALAMYEAKWNAATGKPAYVYGDSAWIATAVTTHPLSTSTKPTGANRQDPRLPYKPSEAWKETPVQKKEGPSFAGYQWLMGAATDSAAAATALATGVKTYNNAINWSDDGKPLSGRSLPELAKARGKACGVVTSVPWSHATPAGLGGAHNRQRDHYKQIAREMLDAATLDVIIGAGNPDFDDNGRPVVKHRSKNVAKAYQYVGGRKTWEQLKSGRHPAGWTLLQSKADFEALAQGAVRPPKRLVGVPQVYATLQQARAKFHPTDTPYYHPLNANVPDLATMTRAALAALEANPDGLYLMIEGGAIDWAGHANQPARMIEEHADFHRAIEAVAAWVERKSHWNETLVIITADHETGLIWGPDADKRPFDPIVDRGRGAIPGLRYLHKSHTNSLVPLFARGPGSESLDALAKNTDARAGAAWGFSGRYLDNADVFRVARDAIVAP